MFGGSTPHEEEAEGGMLSQAVLEKWDILVRLTVRNRSYSFWTHAGVLGVLTVLQMIPHTSL